MNNPEIAMDARNPAPVDTAPDTADKQAAAPPAGLTEENILAINAFIDDRVAARLKPVIDECVALSSAAQNQLQAGQSMIDGLADIIKKELGHLVDGRFERLAAEMAVARDLAPTIAGSGGAVSVSSSPAGTVEARLSALEKTVGTLRGYA